MKIIIESADKLADGIWIAPLSREHALKLGNPKHSKNGCSVVLLNGPCTTTNNSLSFEPELVTLLNVGQLPFSVFVESSKSALHSDLTVTKPKTQKAGYASVKAQCRQHLGRELGQVTASMLDDLSTDTADDLLADKTNRWISRPDNYFTIKVQPQNKDIVVTIRGKPSEYASKSIELHPDQNGYTKFWITQVGEVPEAMRLIRAALARGRLR